MIFAANSTDSTSFDTTSLILILAPSTLALLGVLIQSIISTSNERMRVRVEAASEIFAEKRRANMAALRLTSDTVRALKDWHETMYGNSGEGKDDERSARAIKKLFKKYQNMAELEECAIELGAYGSKAAAAKIDDIAFNIMEYMASLEEDMPRFIAKKAQAFESELDKHFAILVEAVRSDLGVDKASKAVWGRAK